MAQQHPRTDHDTSGVGHAADDALARARAVLDTVTDPEIPVLSIGDLGMLRGVRLDGDTVRVTITPTYSGCPAMGIIELDIVTALASAGFDDVQIEHKLSPAWTTDWLTAAGRRKLTDYGIAPPVEASTSKRALFAEVSVACPRCKSANTERISEFGSTACKALYRCRACAEPFDYFKCI
jgi:ring-1,2-phenylacetyl-CoA epoxidase subunit PaaD